MHVPGAQAVKLLRGVNDRLWLKGGGGTVQINTGIGQRRKLCAELRRTESVYGIPYFNTAIVAQFPRQGKEVDIYQNCLLILMTPKKQVMLNSVRRMF